MMRRHAFVVLSGQHSMACTLQRDKLSPTLLCVCTSAQRTFLNPWARSSTTANNNSGNNSTEDDSTNVSKGKSDGTKSGMGWFGLGSMFLPRGMDMQKLKAIQDALSKQTPEQRKTLLEEMMSLQRSSDKSVGVVERMRRMVSTIEALSEKQEQQQQHRQGEHVSTPSFPTSSSSSTQVVHKASSSARSKKSPTRNSTQGAAGDDSSITTTSCRSGSSDRSSQRPVCYKVPTLDELKKINLGPEIEALFAELRTIRSKKNSYRDKLLAAETALGQVTPELTRLRTAESDLRARLHKAEHDVLLLNSENLELSDKAKKAKELAQSVKAMQAEVREARASAAAGTAVNSPAYMLLKQQLQGKETAMRSLQRKLDRMRLRDPLLQFSLACSDVGRLCAQDRSTPNSAASTTASAAVLNTQSGSESVCHSVDSFSSEASDNGSSSSSASTISDRTNTSNSIVSMNSTMRESADEIFGQLQTAYARAQEAAWQVIAHQNGAAAKAYLAVARQLLLSRVRHAHYDASIVLSSAITPELLTRVRTWFAPLGMEVLDADTSEASSSHGSSARTNSDATSAASPCARLFVCAAADAPATTAGIHGLCGPYGYALAHALSVRAKPPTAATAATTNASFFSSLISEGSSKSSPSNKTAESSSGPCSLDVLRLPQPHFTITSVSPYVSYRLAHNANRCHIRYDTSRSSGPGGQAVNVSETQVHARLSIDGVWAYSAEAQDSRRALSNREAALERLYTKRRQQYNEMLSKECSLEEVTRRLVRVVREAGGLTVREETRELVVRAAQAGEVSVAEAALMSCLQYISNEAAKEDN